MSRRGTAAIVALAAASVLAGCTSTSNGSPQAVGSSPPSSSSTSSSPGSQAASPTLTPSGTAAASSAAPSSSPPAGGSGTPACTIAQLGVRVLRGGAVSGSEIAAITFTNTSRAACSLTGFPGVSLRLAGALLGNPAGRTTTPIHTIVLAAGAAAQAQVTDYTTCQAPLSDAMRIYPPNLTAYVDRPIALRGCAMLVTPVAPS